MTKTYFRVYAWFYLILNIAVILGGAYVRATGSGAGCGVYWPLCQGNVFPDLVLRNTFIEFSHRVSSAVVGFGAVFLVFGAFFVYPSKHPVRFGALAVVCFVIFESLLGAALVLFGLVENNLSIERIWVMGLHLANTFLLLGAITFTAAYSSGFETSKKFLGTQATSSDAVGSFAFGIAGIVCLLMLLITGITGGITALGDTIFRPEYVGQNFFEDLSASSHILQILRAVHPFVAIFSCVILAITVGKFGCQKSKTKFLALCVFALIGVQILVGMLDLLFLTPIGLQILHLFLADALWIITLLYFISFYF